MRLTLLMTLLLTGQAHAWTFTPGLICRLSHETQDAAIALTYDPSGPLYSLTISRAEPLPKVEPFVMRFNGPAGRVISTNNHSFSNDSTAVTAQDSGFGNVLDGLQFNDTAEAILGSTTLTFPLKGAAEPVAAFRACDVATGA